MALLGDNYRNLHIYSAGKEIEDDESNMTPVNDTLKVCSTLKIMTKLKWDIDSPKFKLACAKLGIDPNELQMK